MYIPEWDMEAIYVTEDIYSFEIC